MRPGTTPGYSYGTQSIRGIDNFQVAGVSMFEEPREPLFAGRIGIGGSLLRWRAAVALSMFASSWPAAVPSAGEEGRLLSNRLKLVTLSARQKDAVDNGSRQSGG